MDCQFENRSSRRTVLTSKIWNTTPTRNFGDRSEVQRRSNRLNERPGLVEWTVKIAIQSWEPASIAGQTRRVEKVAGDEWLGAL
jgi:hypothetical protein